MKIIFYDGSTLECTEIEFSSDGKNIIADQYRVIALIEIIRIILI